MAAEELGPWIDSAGQDGNRNSMQEFPCNGVQTSFNFNFAGGYIAASNVKAYVYDTVSGSKTDVSPVVLTGPNTIQVTPAPAAGNFLVVYRDTQKTVPLVDFANGAVLNEANLDLVAKQAVFNAAEMVDRFDEINATSADAIERSFAALNAANAAVATANSAAVAAGNAVSTANAANATAGEASENAADAVATANGIDAKATQAMEDAAAAEAAAQSAAEAAEAAALAASHATQKYDANAIPTTNLGDITVEGVGRMSWFNGAYAPNNLPFRYRPISQIGATYGTNTVTVNGGRGWRAYANECDIYLPATLVKTFQSFAVGNNAGGFVDGGAVGWHHVFVIRRDSDGKVDVCFDSAINAPNRPAGWTAYRRVGAFLLQGDATIRPVVTLGPDRFAWATSFDHVVNGPLTINASAVTLGVPPGVIIRAEVNVFLTNGTAAPISVQMYSTFYGTSSVGGRYSQFTSTPNASNSARVFVDTDTNRNVYYQSASGNNTTAGLYISLIGWQDFLTD
jgi:hypothetical protein